MHHHPTRIPALLTLILLALGALTGCGGDAADPAATAVGGDDYLALDFSDPYGGLTATDEKAAFDDEALLALTLAGEGEAMADPAADDPEVRALLAAGDLPADPTDPQRPRFTFLHLRWGQLREVMGDLGGEPRCARSDWTGSLHVDRGVLLVRRVIRFERPLDRVILERPDPRALGIVSQTACGMDGIVVQIVERPAHPDSTPPPNVLHIALGPFRTEIPVAELAGLEEVHELENAQVALNGFSLSDVTVCPKGFLDGMYRRLPADLPDSARVDDRPGTQYGVFAGMWRELDGRLRGHVRGGYGVDEAGNRILVGKIIGPRGHFRGLIRGTWEPGTAGEVLAAFSAHWAGAGGQYEGRLGGEAFRVAGTAGGFFTGRWAALCDEEAGSAIP